MGDAEIIPIGTRGKPGRGSGRTNPSTSARGLTPAGASRRKPAERLDDAESAAGGGEARSEAATSSSAPGRPAPRRRSSPVADPGRPAPRRRPPPAAGKPVAPAADPTEPTAEEVVVEGLASVLGEVSVEGGPTGPGTVGEVDDVARMEPRPRDHKHPIPGIPVVEWLAAFTTASKEVFGDAWEPRLADFLAFLRRRVTGDYVVDEYGFDPEITQRFFLAALRPLARSWFRIEVRGLENIPREGGALVVSNHSGTVPVDGLMTAVSIFDRTGRHLRPLGADLVFKLPLISGMARKGGATLACHDDAERMLSGGELVGVWPEGFKGIGKPYSERYKLQRFGRGGFVSAAIRTGVPIIPTSVVGAEEIYPLVANVPSLARLLGVPYIPITPLFPLLGPLGLVPLPSKWLIEFGDPIRTDSYDTGAADDPMLVFNVTDQVRETIQQTLYTLLMQRKSVFS